MQVQTPAELAAHKRRIRNTALKVAAFAVVGGTWHSSWGIHQPALVTDTPPKSLHRHRRLALSLGLVALGAFGFGFALVPLYDLLCAVTGYGDRKELTRASQQPSAVDKSRLVTVEFVANLPSVGNWEFKPEVQSMQVQPGRLYEAKFLASNETGPRHLGAGSGRISRRPRPRHLPQDRVFLFHAAAVCRGRVQAHAGALLR